MKLYRENFLSSKRIFRPEEENIYVQSFFSSIWFEGYTTKSVSSPYAVYSIVTKGKVILTRQDGSKQEIGAGVFFASPYLNSGNRYQVPKNAQWERKCIMVRRNAFHDAIVSRFYSEPQMIRLKAPERVEAILDRFQSIFESQHEDSALLSGLFLQMLCEVRSQQELHLYPDSLNKALEYIQMNFRDPNLNRQEIAEAAGISIRTLNRLFLEYGKTSPGKFIDDLRLEYIRTILSNSTLNIKEIAWKNGFSSANFLTRRFRAKYNMTPLEFRKQSRIAGTV